MSITEKRKKHAEYMRRWRSKNREHVRAYRREYYKRTYERRLKLKKLNYEKNKERINARVRRDRSENPEKYRAYDRKRYYKDREKYLAKNRRNYERHRERYLAKKREYVANHKEEMRQWRKQNLDHLIEYNRNKRSPCAPYQFAREESCVVCGITNKESQERWNRRLDIHHVDGNLLNNTKDNLITVCRSCHPKIEYGRIDIPVVE